MVKTKAAIFLFICILFLSCDGESVERAVSGRSGPARFDLGVLLDYCPPPLQDSICPGIELDIPQWVRTVRESRIRFVVMEAEGAGGFSLWNSVGSRDGVRNRGWKGGWGDAVREFVQACRKQHLTAGIALDVRDSGDETRLEELCVGYGNLPWIWTRGRDVSALIARNQPGAVHFGGDSRLPGQGVVTLTPATSFPELQQAYFDHVNRDQNLLLRVCIDSTGVIASSQALLLKRFGTWVNTAFRHPVRTRRGAAKYIRLSGISRDYANYLVIEQDVDRGGKRIREYVVEEYDPENKQWFPLYRGYDIGARHIIPVGTGLGTHLRIKIVRADKLPRIRRAALY